MSPDLVPLPVQVNKVYTFSTYFWYILLLYTVYTFSITLIIITTSTPFSAEGKMGGKKDSALHNQIGEFFPTSGEFFPTLLRLTIHLLPPLTPFFRPLLSTLANISAVPYRTYRVLIVVVLNMIAIRPINSKVVQVIVTAVSIFMVYYPTRL